MDKLQLWSAVEWVCLGDQAHLKTMFEFFLFSTQFDEECTEWVVDWPKVKREGMPGSPWPWKPNSVCTSVSRGYVSRCRVRGCRLHPVGSHFDIWSGSRIFFSRPRSDLKVTLVKMIVKEEGCSMLQRRVSCYIQVLTECEALVVTWPVH